MQCWPTWVKMDYSLQFHMVDISLLVHKPNPIRIFLSDTDLVEESHNLIAIKTLGHHMVDQHHFSRHEKVLWNFHHIRQLIFHHVIYVLPKSLLHLFGIRFDAPGDKVWGKLSWNLSQYFLCKSIWIILQLSEWNKLNYISRCILPKRFTPKWVFISVKLLHLIELSVADTYYDDRQRQNWTLDNFIYSCLQVIDNAIGQY